MGRIYVEVFSDEAIRLTDGRVAWNVPDDKQDELVHMDNSKWELRMYTTADLSERLDHCSDYRKPNKTFNDWSATFLMVIPNYQPKRLRLTLPPTNVNGIYWPVRQIDFEYKSGGVGAIGLL